MGGVFNYVNLHVYHYSANNPVKYVDPDGKWVILFGITLTGGGGTAGTGETGIALSRDRDGKYQIGTYQTSGVGLYGGVGISLNASFTFAPLAQEISNLEGYTETIGGSFSFKLFGTAGGDINIPLNGPKKNFSITLSIGIGLAPKELPGEGHMLTTLTTTNTYAEGNSLIDVWNQAVEAGLFVDFGDDIIEHFKNYLNNYTGEVIP